MNLEIKKNVSMKVRQPGTSLPKIPWDEMYWKDAFDIPVLPENYTSRLSAARSSYKRWQDRQLGEVEREFYIGKHGEGEDIFVRVYCKKGPVRDEDNQSSQPLGPDSQSPF
jgi:hypothetical protein